MIDEKLLDKLEKERHQLIQHREFDLQMIKLARLGLWARDYAIPLIQSVKFDPYRDQEDMKALSALPIERSEKE